MEDKREGKPFFSRFSSFSVILVMIVLMIIGAAMIPLLTIQYTPSIKEQSLTINFSWPDASAKVVEQEVTSKIEGLVSGVRGIRAVSSVSRRGSGRISVSFKTREGVDAMRFEIASLIRRVYPHLPEGVSYPSLSLSTSGERQSAVLTYTLNADLPPQQIRRYAENTLLPTLSRIEGISSVQLSGASAEYIQIRFSPERSGHFGITSAEISNAVSHYGDDRQTVGNSTIYTDGSSGGTDMLLLLTALSAGDLEEIPVKNVSGRIVRLGDVAEVAVREYLPDNYYRVNGLNTINVAVYPEKHVNTLRLTASVKKELGRLEKNFPENFSILLVDDTSEYIRAELIKILYRTVLCVMILLGFVYVMSRNVRYLLLVAVTLTANILVAVIFFCLFRVELHLYSLAGATVSLGIIIDTAIIMIDHYGHYRDSRVFVAIFAALLTTIASLSVVFLLSERQRANLEDFASVIIINLVISLLIALLFIPALMDKIRYKEKAALRKRKMKLRRRVVKTTRWYGKIIRFERRWRWVLIVSTVLAFGLPVHLLPDRINSAPGQTPSLLARAYDKTVGSPFYQIQLKEPLETYLGGVFRLFHKGISKGDFYREPERPELTIQAGMAEGCTVHQLNEVITAMENFLSQFEEIGRFVTRVNAYDNGSIRVTFKKEQEGGHFPRSLKQAVISKAINFGGANWSVYGIDDQGFNNHISGGYKSHRIRLTGYEYDRLYDYAEQLIGNLSANRRVAEPGIYGEVGWGNVLVRSEYHIRFDAEKLSLYGLTLNGVYSALNRLLSEQRGGQVYLQGEPMDVNIVIDPNESVDLWHLNNQYFDINGILVRLGDIAAVEKRQMGNDIYRSNQQYRLFVAYDFIGPNEMANRFIRQETERMQDKLPLGFKAAVEEYGWNEGAKSREYLFILLIIGIIYFIGSVLFESLRQPLIVISLIPVSYIGVFLVFYLTGFRFDQGGFASFVLLSGIVVNAGFYIINEYNHLDKDSRQTPLRKYLKACNRKIIPILLTVISTVLGLIPFLFEGPEEVFWFSFAVGTMGGMVFNLIALIFYLPVFMPLKTPERNKKSREARNPEPSGNNPCKTKSRPNRTG